MAVVRDAELLYMVVRRGRGSCSQKYRTKQHDLTENQVVSTFLFSLPTTQVCMSSVSSVTGFGGFGLTSGARFGAALTIYGDPILT
jgi:hypothetical protein